jgi:hypothetical protein
MLRSALALLSSLQIGARIKDTLTRTIRQAVVAAVGVVVLIAAVVFGLVAAYHALILSYGFTPTESAAIVAGALALLGVLILAMLPLFGRPSKTKPASMQAAASEGAAMLDQSVGRVMQQLGPVGMLAIAFIAGALISRRK